MNCTEFAVRTGVTEVKGELLRLYVDPQRSCVSWREINRAPCFGSNKGQREDLDAYNDDRGCDERCRSPGKHFYFSAGSFVAGSPGKEGQYQLTGKEEDAGPD